MYKEIASNKRRTLAVIVSFLVIWLAIGVVAGLLFKALYHPAAHNGYATAPPPNYGWSPADGQPSRAASPAGRPSAPPGRMIRERKPAHSARPGSGITTRTCQPRGLNRRPAAPQERQTTR